MECLKCGEDCELSNHNFFCSDECAAEFWDGDNGMAQDRKKQLWNDVIQSTTRSAYEHLKRAFCVSSSKGE
jgi:hypothetical protein